MIIVCTAIELVEHDGVVAIADDTDILVLFVHQRSHQFFMEMNLHIIAIDAALRALRGDMCRSLLFVHAMTWCDATSTMFGVRKTKAFKVRMHTVCSSITPLPSRGIRLQA